MTKFPRPARYASDWFERMEGDIDPALRSQLAHDTASALLSRVRAGADEAVVERLLTLAGADGIDTVAELWASATPHSLPGALWRINLVHAFVTQRGEEAALLYREGAAALDTVDPVLAGLSTPTGTREVEELSAQILRGVFAGDFADALERASAYCAVAAHGATLVADDVDALHPNRASELTRRASQLATIARDLRACVPLWRRHELY